MLGNFSCFFKNFFQKCCQSVKQFGSRSGPIFCQPYLGPTCLQRLSQGKILTRKKCLQILSLTFQCLKNKMECYHWSFFFSSPSFFCSCHFSSAVFSSSFLSDFAFLCLTLSPSGISVSSMISPSCTINRGSYMSAHVLLNLLIKRVEEKG